MNTDVISFKFYFFFNNVKNFHFLLGTHSSDDALVKEIKHSVTTVMCTDQHIKALIVLMTL